MGNIIKTLLVVVCLFSSIFAFSAIQVNKILHWNAPNHLVFPEKLTQLNFTGATYNPKYKGLPVYFELISLPAPYSSVSASFQSSIFIPSTDEENEILKNLALKSSVISVSATVSFEKKSAYAVIEFLPFRFNNSLGRFEKLSTFGLRVTPGAFLAKTAKTTQFSTSSVLQNGVWYKIGVIKDGVHKLTFSALKKMGLDSVVSPVNLRLFGNGGGMVPESNSLVRMDDLAENPIVVIDENNNGKFDLNDYILFYGQGPNRWYYNLVDNHFHHKIHKYSDTTYYFVTADLGPGKRLQTVSTLSSPTNSVNTFDDFGFHEENKYNLIKSGAEWYGESFEIQTKQEFSFTFPDLVSTSPLYLHCDMVGRSTLGGSFDVDANGQNVMSFACSPIGVDYWRDFAIPAISNTSGNAVAFTSSGSEIKVGIKYNKPNSSSAGWLNYIELNAKRKLVMSSNQMLFRDTASVGPGKISEFNLIVNSTSTQVWDVTDPRNAFSIIPAENSSVFRFSVATDNLREFIAFNNTGFPTPALFGKIENQNLHGLSQTEMIIVAHPKFISEANRLADFHRTKDGISVIVVTPQQIFNEFSSGAQDISAIRDFVRMFYQRATTVEEQPKYLLLFGDGSYDPKDRIPANTNFICTCQSDNSLSPTSSYVTDDFFVQLDATEGNCGTGGADLPDVAVGRFPVKSPEEAKSIVDKIINYESTGSTQSDAGCTNATSAGSSFGDWRNIVCFIADDGDGNTHLNQADGHAGYLERNYPDYNLEKIYFDAYKMESTPGGQRFPDVNAAINRRMDRGALIVNYTGHGGESGWAHERVLDVSMINSWKNSNTLPLFFTATCEFSRFDNPELTSAGELVLLNPRGGGISLMTTTRLVYSSPNEALNQNFYEKVFLSKNGVSPLPIGEIFRQTKVKSGPDPNNRNFTLLGDPALRLAYPKYEVATTVVQNHKTFAPYSKNTISENAQNRQTTLFANQDTVRALSKVTIKGEIRDNTGLKLTSFNGIIYPTVYDKADSIQTLGNKAGLSFKTKFKLRKNIIYRGKASVKNGEFSFTFVVPKDISYQYGFGRISYYAQDGKEDANGYYENFIIGGIDPNAPEDLLGPKVKLYMNDEKFSFGGMTDENPKLFAVLSDSNGVNTVGNGIGHDLAAVLDYNNSSIYVLNDYYESDLDSYQSGKIIYPFKDLKTGQHHLQLKVWDVYNNSSDAETEFIVAPSAEFALEHVLNYPNPFTTHTSFYFEHNRPCSPLTVQVQIFTITGKLIKTIETPVLTEGYHAGPVEWNGRDEFGDKIGKGVYVYRLRVRTADGKLADKLDKLVILN